MMLFFFQLYTYMLSTKHNDNIEITLSIITVIATQF
jgi:hypothetical protein